MVRLRLLRFGVPFPGQARAVASLASCSGSGLREAEAKLGRLRVELTATIARRTTLDKRRKTISLFTSTPGGFSDAPMSVRRRGHHGPKAETEISPINLRRLSHVTELLRLAAGLKPRLVRLGLCL